jgi:hypothetical protein
MAYPVAFVKTFSRVRSTTSIWTVQRLLYVRPPDRAVEDPQSLRVAGSDVEISFVVE